MKRRDFLSISASAAALAALPRHGIASQPAKRASAKPSEIKLGHEYRSLDDGYLKSLVDFSVSNVGGPPVIADKSRLYATVEELERTRDTCKRNGLVYDLVTPPFLASSFINTEKHPAIMLAQSPERDRDIAAFNTYIKNCAAAGIPAIKYNMSILGVLRSGREPGRGDTSYAYWNLATTPPSKLPRPRPPLTIAGRVDADAFWERITYFLDRTVPVANEYKVRMALHPQDPGVPPSGYEGVDRVLGTVDGLKKFISIQESPYHGLNFCQGTISEMLEDPGSQIFDVIRYFGSRNKIFNVHFRNILGHRNSFAEVYPDAGSVDFVKAIQVYKEVGYSHSLMPDHPQVIPNDPGAEKSFIYDFGYIRGLIQSVNDTPHLGDI